MSNIRFYQRSWSLKIHRFTNIANFNANWVIQFLSIFCTYLWETHSSKNISKVHGLSYLYGMGKNIVAKSFVLFFPNKDISLTSLSSNPSLWQSVLYYLIYLFFFMLYFNLCIYVYSTLVYHYCLSNILQPIKIVRNSLPKLLQSKTHHWRIVSKNKLENKIRIGKSKSTWEQSCQSHLGTTMPVSLGNNCASVTWEQSC